MIVADLARMGIMLTFSMLMAWTAGWGEWGPFLPLAMVGGFAALFSPARLALMPTLIRSDQLARANGMMAGLGIIGTMFALFASGYLAQYYRPQLAFHLDAATYFTSAVLLWFITAQPQRVERRERNTTVSTAVRELRHGFRYVWQHRRVAELVAIGTLVWFCGPLVKCAIPAIARDFYDGDYQTISWYRAYLGLGFIIGSVGITVLGSALRSEVAVNWGLLGVALAMAVFAASCFLPVSPEILSVIGAIGITGAGVAAVAIMAGLNALLQRIVADRYRGRVFGVRDLCSTSALLLATGVLGVPRWQNLDEWVGYILVVVAAMMLVAWWFALTIRLRRSRFGPWVTLLQNVNDFICRAWWRFRREGPVTVPRDGPVIITANHRSAADPLFLLNAVPYRLMGFMVAAEYTDFPGIRSLMRLIECIPTRRGSRDPGATKQAIRQLRQGKMLGIFIEGGIPRPGERRRPKDGVAMLALKTGATVIPAYISGAKWRKSVLGGLLTRHDICVRFGPPVDLSEFRSARTDRRLTRSATRRIYEAIRSLAPPHERDRMPPYPENRDDADASTEPHYESI